ncbi:MAG: leucine-rich repeat domain-containing protein, partial [Clostridia bacterium]|nr:leucine-rich repeat domain-containing protein [Clostridia bacterium]
MPSSAKIYTVNEKVIAYATKNGKAYETLSATIEADKVELVKGQSSNFTATVTGLDVVYQWVNSGVDIVSATNATYIDTSAEAVTREIALKVVDILGNEKTSNVVKVRYYSDNTYTLFEINDDGVLIKYHGTSTNVIVPEYIDKDISSGRILSIGNGAFRENTTLVSLTLPQSVVSIESGSDASKGAFYGCVDLRSVIVTSALTYVGDYAFSGCISLTTFGYDGVSNNLTKLTYVGISAFNGTSLRNIVLKDIVTIGENAFIDNNGTYLGIASSSDSIKVKTTAGEIAIEEATSLITDVQIYTNNENVVTYALNNELSYLVTSVEVVGATKAVAGESVTLTANAQGYGIEYTWMNSAAVIQPDTYDYVVTVTSEDQASVTYVLVIMDALGDVYTVEHSVRYYPDNLYSIFETDNGVLDKYNGEDTNVVIPEYVYAGDESKHITKIGANAFSGNTTIVSVTLPSSVTAIESGVLGQGAFYNCTNLEYVVYTTNLVDIGDFAFSG